MTFDSLLKTISNKVSNIELYYDSNDTWVIFDTIHDTFKAIIILPFNESKKLIKKHSTFIPMIWDNTESRPVKVFKACNLSSMSEFLDTQLSSITSFPTPKAVHTSYLQAILSNPVFVNNGFAISLLQQVERLSDKQRSYVIKSAYSSSSSFEYAVQKKDPNFLINYINEQSERLITKVEPVKIKKTKKKIISTKDITVLPVDTTETCRTKNYKAHNYQFKYFNPIQTKVLKYKDIDNNILIAANTSSGKTICAEIIMDVCLEKGKTIYLSPLKALTQEKYNDWSRRFSDKRIAILTGDYTLSSKRKKELEDADIICMTSEMLDSRSRRMSTENNQWLFDVSLLIVDEFHIIGAESRGHSAESGLMRFSKMNPSARLICLSATVPNIDDFGIWLKTLNNKQVHIIESDWRPVELEFNYSTYDDSNCSSYQEKQQVKIESVVNIVRNKHTEQFLIFCHDKNTIRKMVAALDESGIESLPHTADLTLQKRKSTEKAFETGAVKILVCTSTLAWGRNLPAKNVVITGVHRGINEIEELDIIQMCGRAGRLGYHPKGYAYLVIQNRIKDNWEYRLNNQQPIMSSLMQKEVLAFHLLSEITSKAVTELSHAFEWYHRSLASTQNIAFTDSDLMEVITDLKFMKMIKPESTLTSTGLGNVSALLYFSPYDVHDWHTNFNHILKIKNTSNLMLAWAIGNVKSKKMSFTPKQLQDDEQTLKQALFAEGIPNTQNIAVGQILGIKHALDGTVPHSNYLAMIARTVVMDLDRSMTALKMIDSFYTRWEYDWESLAITAKYGVSSELFKLVGIPKVGKTRAKKLYRKGIKSLEDIVKCDLAKLNKIIGPGIARAVKEYADANTGTQTKRKPITARIGEKYVRRRKNLN